MNTSLQRYFMQKDETELETNGIDDTTIVSKLKSRLRKLQSSKVVFGLTANYKARWVEEISIMLELKKCGAHTEDFLDIDEQIKERQDLVASIDRK